MGVDEDSNSFKDDSGVILESVDRKKVVRTEEEIKKMGTKQYLDEMIIPTLNKALLKVNKDRPINPIEYLGHYFLKVANEPPSPVDENGKSISSASTPTPMD